MPVKRYQLLEHTADICVKVFGRDLKALFRNSAFALFDIVSRKKKGTRQIRQTTSIRKSAENIEELLISWLSELLSLSDARNLIFTQFKIGKLTGKKIEAVVAGFRKENFHIKTEIKAATYHELKVEKTKSGWQAQVIFDV
jgi:SHS2 domain-containing protein